MPKINAFLIAIVLAFSPTHIFYSQEARHYIFLYFFTTAVTLLLMKINKNLSESKDIFPDKCLMVMLVLSTVGLLNTHYFGLFFVFFLAPLTFLFFRRASLAYLLALGLGVLSYLPWLKKTYFHFFYSPSNSWLPAIGPWEALKSSFGFYLYGRYQFASNSILVLLIGLSIYVLVYSIKKKDNFGKLLFAWLYIPLILILVKSELTHPSFHKRYLIICMPAALMINYYISNFLEKQFFKRGFPIVLTILIFYVGYSYSNPILNEKTCQRPPSFDPNLIKN
jgi:uncharacterized membrane protein